MFGTDRNQLRLMYKNAWEKHLQQQLLSPLESQIADVIQQHPEYHDFIKQIHKDFLPEAGESNPFLHMGLHLGLREQIATDRPAGIAKIYRKLLKNIGSPHDTEHAMIDCLGEAMWSSQVNNQAPDEAKYLRCLKKLGKK